MENTHPQHIDSLYRTALGHKLHFCAECDIEFDEYEHTHEKDQPSKVSWIRGRRMNDEEYLQQIQELEDRVGKIN